MGTKSWIELGALVLLSFLWLTSYLLRTLKPLGYTKSTKLTGKWNLHRLTEGSLEIKDGWNVGT